MERHCERDCERGSQYLLGWRRGFPFTGMRLIRVAMQFLDGRVSVDVVATRAFQVPRRVYKVRTTLIINSDKNIRPLSSIHSTKGWTPPPLNHCELRTDSQATHGQTLSARSALHTLDRKKEGFRHFQHHCDCRCRSRCWSRCRHL